MPKTMDIVLSQIYNIPLKYLIFLRFSSKYYCIMFKNMCPFNANKKENRVHRKK